MTTINDDNTSMRAGGAGVMASITLISLLITTQAFTILGVLHVLHILHTIFNVLHVLQSTLKALHALHALGLQPKSYSKIE
jgi:hypothetical protein